MAAPDPGQRLPARRGDGEGRRLPGRAARARASPTSPGWRPIVLGLGAGHHARRRLPGAAADTTSSCCWPSARSASSASSWCWSAPAAASSALAGLAMLVAHALFKSTLFLVVGVIDHATGTRDLRRLSGLGRRLPVLAGVGALAAASMAGLPPLLGLRRQGGGVRPRSWTADCPTAPLPSSCSTGAGRRLGADRRRTRCASCWGAFAAQARARRRRAGRARRTAPGPLFLAAPAVLAAGRAGRRARPPAARAAASRPTPTRCRWSRPRPRHLALWHGLQPRPGRCRRSPARRRRAVRRPRAGSTGSSAGSPSAPRPTRATGTSMQGLDRLAVAGHRHHPARLAAGLPRHDPASSSSRCPARCC